MKDKRFVRDFFIFYVATLLFFAVGIITSLGLSWYGALTVPSWTPPEIVVATIWGILFVTTVLSLSVFYDAQPTLSTRGRNTVLIYMVNALLILLWNYLFFGIHILSLALWAGLAVGVTVLVLIVRVKKVSFAAAWLLAPYLLWVIYATAISYAMLTLN